VTPGPVIPPVPVDLFDIRFWSVRFVTGVHVGKLVYHANRSFEGVTGEKRCGAPFVDQWGIYSESERTPGGFYLTGRLAEGWASAERWLQRKPPEDPIFFSEEEAIEEFNRRAAVSIQSHREQIEELERMVRNRGRWRSPAEWGMGHE
jgi:hypothetical protein